jgi:DNA-binding transcriptional MerR regulator/methylmalonyl-CoA mutase cobalamin-binding subunit
MPQDSAHPIGVVAERTGLTPDVIRVWERRYQVVEPRRSPGGQRIYSDADIERLAMLHRATRRGHGISHVASLSKSKLEQLVRDVESSGPAPFASSSASSTTASDPRSIVTRAIAFTETLDPAALESLLRRAAARYGIVAFLDAIAAPFLRAMGDLWHARKLTIAQEHLATAVVQRVVADTAPLLTGGDRNPVIVIATLPGERHANGALMTAAISASEGWRVVYLGTDLPTTEIATTAVRTGARAIAISVVSNESAARASAELGELARSITDETRILVGGAAAARLNVDRKRVTLLSSMLELRAELDSIG